MTSPYFSRPSTRTAAAKALAALGSTGTRPSQIRSLPSLSDKTAQQSLIKNEELESKDHTTKQKSQQKKRKNKSPKVVSPKKEKAEERVVSSGWEPPNWREVLNKIKVMRQNEDAPVDSQGCERTADEDEKPEVYYLRSVVY